MQTRIHTLKLTLALLMATISISALAQTNWENKGFWSFGTETEWSEQNLDKAFVVFKRLKETYGDQFNLVVQDLHKEGKPMANGSKSAQILIKIYVSPPNQKIEKELRNVGLKYVK